MNLNWGTCGNNSSWCGFFSVNLAGQYFDGKEGVYIIWQKEGSVIRVGKGIIRDRLTDHRNDKEISLYTDLFVTWAVVEPQRQNGVERYLADSLHPRVGDVFPDVDPIEVNLPWTY